MKLLACLSFNYVGLVLLTLNNGVYNIPISGEYSLYDSDSAEDVGLTFSDCIESEDCMKLFTDNGNKVGRIIVDLNTKSNCTTEVNTDKNAMPNDAQVLTRSTEKKLNNNTYNVTSTTERNYEFNEVVESEINGLVSSNVFNNDIDELVFEKSDAIDGHVGVSLIDDVHYEDIPGILIISIVNYDGETRDIDVGNAAEVSGDEITLDFNSAVQALADFIDNMSSEDGMEWTEDSEFEDPHRIVEDGYIFYDMGKIIFYTSLFFLHFLIINSIHGYVREGNFVIATFRDTGCVQRFNKSDFSAFMAPGHPDIVISVAIVSVLQLA